jgi:hypothetical protein
MKPGSRNLQIQLVEEGIGPIPDEDGQALIIPVEVQKTSAG